MQPPKNIDQECIERIQAATDAALRGGASHAQIVGALTVALVRVAWSSPHANRSLRLAVEILADADGRSQQPGESEDKVRRLN